MPPTTPAPERTSRLSCRRSALELRHDRESRKDLPEHRICRCYAAKAARGVITLFVWKFQRHDSNCIDRDATARLLRMEDRGAASSEKISSHLPRRHFHDGALQVGDSPAKVFVHRITETHQRGGGGKLHLPLPRFVWILEAGPETSGHFNQERVGSSHGALCTCWDSLVDRAFLPVSNRAGNQCCVSFHGESKG
jgi:hypothetical protein